MLKSKIVSALSVVCLLFGFYPVGVGAVAVSVKGEINSLVWTEIGSPYLVEGVVTVAQGAKLTIKPGALVKFKKGSKLVVNGELEAIGSFDKPIIFTSNEASQSRGDWQGIEFGKQSVDATYSSDVSYVSGSVIKNAIIKYSQGIICNDASPLISYNSFINNKIGVDIIGTSSSAGVEVLDQNDSTEKHAGLTTIRVDKNEFTDSDTAIRVNRNNGRDYINTPAGSSFTGELITTSILSNNTITNSNNGIIISKGDNNVILNNTFKYNSGTSVSIDSGNGNIVQGNFIGKNNIGLTVSGKDTVILLNNIDMNDAQGVNLNKPVRLMKNNNITNNRIGLNNKAGDIDVSGNFWGESQDDAGNIVVNAQGIAAVSPVLSTAASSLLIKPILDSYITVTNANNQTFSGIKPYGVELYVDNMSVTGFKNKFEWTYKTDLVIGDNIKTFYFVDENNAKGEEATAKVTREKIIVVDAPTVAAYPKETSKGSIVISGAKQSGSSIWVNKTEVVPVNSLTTWNYTLSLVKGMNTINLYSKDSNGVTSQTVEVSVSRVDVDVKTISQDEKKLTKIDTTFAKKMSGKLLLQVEGGGAIWYVNPKDNLRYLITADNAVSLLKSLATGINEKNVATIITKATKNNANKIGQAQKGKFLLRVEAGGKLVYVDMDGYRHDIDATNVIKAITGLSGGISNLNIRKIGVGGV